MTERYRIEEAERRRQQEVARLYRADGSKLYADEEHAERERRIKAEFGETMGRIEADIEGRIGRAQEQVLLHETYDPADALTTEELARANAKSAFVADDVQRLSTADLVRRCRAAIASGDRVNAFLLARHGQRRAEAEGTVFELAEAVDDLRRALEPDREAKMARARRDLAEAEDLLLDAQLARHGGAAYNPNASSYWTP